MLQYIVYITILLFILGAIFFFVLNYIVYRAFHFEHVVEKNPPDAKKFNFKEIFVPTENGKKIHLYDLNPETNTGLAIVALHGWANSVHIFLPIAEKLIKTGRVFLLNARNHGKSDSDDSMTILKYEADLRHALDYIRNTMGKNTTLVVMGHSLGAAASILTAADDRRVAGVIAISSFADIRQIMYHGFLNHKIPGWLALIVIKYIELRIGRSLNEVSPQNSIRRFDKPTLLIHGTNDKMVPFTNLEILFKSANRSNVEMFVAEGHSHSSLLYDAQVSATISGFVEKYFVKKGDLQQYQ